VRQVKMLQDSTASVFMFEPHTASQWGCSVAPLSSLPSATLQRRSDLYIPKNETVRHRPRSVCLFFCSKRGGPIVGIYKALTETFMRKLGTRPRSFISVNICFEFSIQCLGSAHSLFYDIFNRRAVP
jgi:hypothetical protein